MALNPFIWDRPLEDPAKIVGMEAFANQVALRLKGQTNVALFGPRDTGKTTFTSQLALELAKDHGPDAPPFTVVRIDLQRALSLPAFCACVHDALAGHPLKAVRREARRRFAALEKEIGFDIKIVKGAVRRSGVTAQQDAESLHAMLAALRALGEHVVVIFDEFQRLRRCPGEPLAIVRSALMSGGANHVSLLLTGSIRNALAMMLERSEEPLFGEAAQMQLPAIDPAEFLEYLDFQFTATGKPADEEALEHIVALTEAHPRRTQQLAWEAWEAHSPRARAPLSAGAVQDAYDRLLSSGQAAEFAMIASLLAEGDDSEVNELRALSVLADRGGGSVTSRELLPLYGFASHTTVLGALERLRRRGLVEQHGEWRIVDPFFAAWLRRHSPLTLRAPID